MHTTLTCPEVRARLNATHRRQGEEGDSKDREAGRHDLAEPGPWHRVAVTDRCHGYLKKTQSRRFRSLHSCPPVLSIFLKGV